MSADQKTAIYKGLSQVPLDVLGKPLDWTWSVFRKIEMENWGWRGMPVVEYRQMLAKSKAG